MAEATRIPDSHEEKHDSLSNLDRIFNNFWLKLEHRMQQCALQLSESHSLRQPPPDPQQQLAALVGNKAIWWQRREKHPSLPCKAEGTIKTKRWTSSNAYRIRGDPTPAARPNMPIPNKHAQPLHRNAASGTSVAGLCAAPMRHRVNHTGRNRDSRSLAGCPDKTP
ncbi:Hypothetical predicted protein [Pelobates cultripes]|uniref:Uncharacterized protein n=1 Tax=Pelobates cultripes TaxID=61616 RepID=A0AAD1WRD0_PELCU|nr:Hypothetical predicted protein [Pelobates cultripes]